MTPSEGSLPGALPPGADDFPSQSGATARFTRGVPRALRVLADGRVVFLRSAGGRDPRGDLWVFDPASGHETMLVAAHDLLADEADLPAAERARRERLRESGAGITAYDVAEAARLVCFAYGGRLFVAGLDAATGAAPLDVPGPVVDPRISTDGDVAWHANGRVWCARADGSGVRPVTPPDDASWGLADFIAAEEFGRSRGFWWSPDGRELLVCRVDEAGVDTWWIADPAAPDRAPHQVRYPAAGTSNARVSLWRVDVGGESDPREVLRVGGDEPFEYLTTVSWGTRGALVQVLNRDQRHTRIVTLDTHSGDARTVAEWRDPQWVDVVAGVPRWDSDGRLLTVRADRDGDAMRLYRGEEAVTPDHVQVRNVIGVSRDSVVLGVTTDGITADIVALAATGELREVCGGGWWSSGSLGGGYVAATGAGLDSVAWRARVVPLAAADPQAPSPADAVDLRSVAEIPKVPYRLPRFGRVGAVRYAVHLPADDAAAAGPYPVLMLPYGGPHGQKVMSAGPAHMEAAWWASRGYAVVIADGRGTPGVGPAWERSVAGNLAGPVLDDQVRALDAVVSTYGDLLDGSRVGITGWSFGGYLAALAVLARPERFHAAVAGAPVVDWRLYDTGYTERYLGTPSDNPEAYEVSDLLPLAGELDRPLLLIHGLADDNVVAAHTLRLSTALLQAGRPHAVLPLTGVTHMTGQAEVAANLLRLQAAFFDRHLRVPASAATT